MMRGGEKKQKIRSGRAFADPPVEGKDKKKERKDDKLEEGGKEYQECVQEQKEKKLDPRPTPEYSETEGEGGGRGGK